MLHVLHIDPLRDAFSNILYMSAVHTHSSSARTCSAHLLLAAATLTVLKDSLDVESVRGARLEVGAALEVAGKLAGARVVDDARVALADGVWRSHTTCATLSNSAYRACTLYVRYLNTKTTKQEGSGYQCEGKSNTFWALIGKVSSRLQLGCVNIKPQIPRLLCTVYIMDSVCGQLNYIHMYRITSTAASPCGYCRSYLEFPLKLWEFLPRF